MRGILEDLRYAAGVLRRTPAWTALIAVLTLALGYCLPPPPQSLAGSMGWSCTRSAVPRTMDDSPSWNQSHASGTQAPSVSYVDCRDFQDSLRSISGLLLNQKGPASVGDGENAYSAWFEVVSGNYFDVLGVKPSLGRTFTRDEYGDRAGALTAVISYRLWQEYFRGDPSILGRAVRINRRQVTIVGVAPSEFHGDFPGTAMDGWIPAPLTGESRRNARNFQAIVRLKPGVSISEANAEAATVAARLARAFPKTNEGIGARIVPIWKAQEGASGVLASPMAILGAACGLVLLIACANVTNLLLARSASRRREFGIRTALGAGPGRLSRQLVSESLLLAALATLAGLPLALCVSGPPRKACAAYGNTCTYFQTPTPSARVFFFLPP